MVEPEADLQPRVSCRGDATGPDERIFLPGSWSPIWASSLDAARLDRRSARERERENPPAARQEDMAVELKRLRREKNEVLRQGRESLKRATAFFAKEGS